MEEEALRLARHGSLSAAADVCRALTARHPRFGPGWRAASSIALQMGDAAGALSFIDHALALSPAEGRALLLKAQALRAVGRHKEAFEMANMARAQLADDAVALDSLGSFYSLSGEARLALDVYERALQLTPRNAWRSEVQLRYALAKEYEDLEEYARSWAHLEQGARLQRRHLKYDIAQDIQVIDRIMDGAAAAAAHPKSPTIFLVGLPRSGATRVARILGNHSSVSAGKLNIDRTPLNYLHCGSIRRALPNARMVHLTCHPLAVSYTMYKTLFKDGYGFSYDLDEIGRYYLAYRRLMDHWQASLPGALYNLSYEQLIADPIGETRRLLDFCGLEQQDACLASAAQIRHTSEEGSVHQWRHYAQQLAKLRDQLVAGGMEVPS
jgi:tetratricopeptide (TPR) repeat protein